MIADNPTHSSSVTPPRSVLQSDASVLSRIKDGYLIWMNIVPHISKSQRYTIGARIENKFLDLLELSYITYFTERENKKEKLIKCIIILDTLKYLITITWETRLISGKQCSEISEKLEEVGKMLGGWRNSLENPEKKNRAV